MSERRIGAGVVAWLAAAWLTACTGGDAAPRHSGPARLAIAPLPASSQPDDALDGLRAGVAAAGLREGQDYVWVDPSRDTPPDVWLAASPTALSAALRASGGASVVFTDVAAPGAAGARAPTLLRRWAPWLLREPGTPVTGVSATTDFRALLGAAAPLLGTRPAGVVFVPGDADSSAWQERLQVASDPAGRALLSEPFSDASAAAAAVGRLCERGAGGLVLLGDRASDAALPALFAAAQACGMPVFGTRRAHADAGAVVTLARDVRGAGHAAGLR
ncbi:MAG: hypothetical protein SF182_27720, partial [Deltaproteobacteria bacterium]|nr:hypothetical protein [Deltaproteobacteria bacterium]